MGTVVIPLQELGYRVHMIQALLRPLRGGRDVACCIDTGMYHGGKAVAAHDGLASGSDYRDWRFWTSARDLLCQYFELWRPSQGGRCLLLHRAYLNVFWLNRQTHSTEELVCVHCDPGDASQEPTCRYKRGPHLHVMKAEEPLPHCHFPLNLGQLDDILTSADSLTGAMEMAVGVISDEVLSRFPQR